MIAIVDYEMGNLKSVMNAFEAIGQKVFITSNPSDLATAAAIVLPGVGAFGDGMRNLRDADLVDALNEEVLVKRKPFLGICLGLQFLASVGMEHGEHEGLGWINGKVIRLEPNGREFRVPHIGWNDVQIQRGSRLFDNLEDGPIFYFVHSYHICPEDATVITATCWHGQTVTAAIQKDNIYGVQFHPEKSQRSGLNVLKNFVKLT